MSDLPIQSQRAAEWIEKQEIGALSPILTPFGEKPLVYADYTASGRSLSAIETILAEQVMPYYANTHSESSYSGAHTTRWREAARQMIKESVNAGSDDRVVFCGSGATAAINRLIQLLGLEKGGELSGSAKDTIYTDAASRPVVFIGPYEHHSNELPWRESLAEVVAIPLDATGQINQAVLAQKLQQYADRPLRLGSFSAASNVSGVLSDVEGITRLLKQHGALACWDYAAAAAYCPMNMSGDPAIDAMFISTHKLPGGPGTPGLLIAKSHLFRNKKPGIPGGGTVSFVSPDHHDYLSDLERKEEGGTPAIIESIRAGLVFSVRSNLDMDQVKSTEIALAQRAIARLQKHSNIEIIGNADNPRLPILSLRFWHQGKQLHYGFIVSLLNDLFGIQARGGCSCAGPYAHHLLDIDRQQSQQLLAAMRTGDTVLRPGWVRVNLTYFMSEPVIEYILSALELLSEHAIELLPLYVYDRQHGVWHHQQSVSQYPLDLSRLDWFKQSTKNVKDRSNTGILPTELSAYLHQAETELSQRNAVITGVSIPSHALDPLIQPENERLRWFWLAEDLN
jgi:selenocysteine lyase/cysteine desulfurase